MDSTESKIHTQNPDERWDKVGLFLSGLCALHCLLTPIIILFLPVLGSALEQEFIHIALAFLVGPVGVYAFWNGLRLHKNTRIFTLGIFGVVLVVAASFLPHHLTEIFEIDLITIFGSICLLIAHILNRRACTCGNH